ncbi:MAG: hypothetical protein F6K47_42910 [Symploca sp. SIO2E6]|nr:hypothetical protein [Symploca sp. SIO2E6]
MVAVVEFLNKLKDTASPSAQNNQNDDKFDLNGFTDNDSENFAEISPIILKFLEGFKDLYQTTRKKERASKLEKAISSVSKSNANSEQILVEVKNAAEKLVNADRSSLWRLDRKNNKLWTYFDENRKLNRQEVEIGKGYVGRAAEDKASESFQQLELFPSQ